MTLLEDLKSAAAYVDLAAQLAKGINNGTPPQAIVDLAARVREHADNLRLRMQAAKTASEDHQFELSDRLHFKDRYDYLALLNGGPLP